MKDRDKILLILWMWMTQRNDQGPELMEWIIWLVFVGLSLYATWLVTSLFVTMFSMVVYR